MIYIPLQPVLAADSVGGTLDRRRQYAATTASTAAPDSAAESRQLAAQVPTVELRQPLLFGGSATS